MKRNPGPPGAETLGLLYVMFPIGYILGGAWAGHQATLRHRGYLVHGGVVVAELMLVLFGLPLPLAVLLPAAVINGAVLEAGNLARTHTLQDPAFVPRALLGRVASIDLLGTSVLLPIGYACAGWATAQFGPALAFVVGGGVTALISVAALLHPRVREVD